LTGEIDYGDLPMERPEQDLFGTDPFIRALACGLMGMKSPQGVVRKHGPSKMTDLITPRCSVLPFTKTPDVPVPINRKR
jgi:hypothetical protein